MKKIIILLPLLFTSYIASGQTMKDTLQVMQLCIDHEKFQGYYHPEVEGRLPITIIDNGIAPVVSGLEKSGEKVLFATKAALLFYNKEDYLVFTEFKINEGRAQVKFNYPIEGANANILLWKNDETWTVAEASVGER